MNNVFGARNPTNKNKNKNIKLLNADIYIFAYKKKVLREIGKREDLQPPIIFFLHFWSPTNPNLQNILREKSKGKAKIFALC